MLKSTNLSFCGAHMSEKFPRLPKLWDFSGRWSNLFAQRSHLVSWQLGPIPIFWHKVHILYNYNWVPSNSRWDWDSQALEARAPLWSFKERHSRSFAFKWLRLAQLLPPVSCKVLLGFLCMMKPLSLRYCPG